MSKSIDVAVKSEPSLDSGMPYVVRGMFHLNVPRPMKSVPKAKECFHEALKVREVGGPWSLGSFARLAWTVWKVREVGVSGLWGCSRGWRGRGVCPPESSGYCGLRRREVVGL